MAHAAATTEPNPPRLIKKRAVIDATSLPQSTLYRLIAEGKFPAPIKPTGARSSAWIESEVSAWIGARIAERDERAA